MSGDAPAPPPAPAAKPAGPPANAAVEAAVPADAGAEAPTITAAPLPAAASVTRDPWTAWRAATPARLALGRAGSGMPTDETLRFAWAHAQARDAVHAALDVGQLTRELHDAGWNVDRVRSQAADRTTYLRRPDLGRQLADDDAARLRSAQPLQGDGQRPDVSIVIADGLSALAVQRHAVPLLVALRPLLPPGTRHAPVVVALQARVALGDAVAEALGARLCVLLIGERPGLSSPDSLGIYLTHAPRRGRSDAERNCISNVRPEGLPCAAAACKLAWLMREALRRGVTGVALKDESDMALLDDGAVSSVLLPDADDR